MPEKTNEKVDNAGTDIELWRSDAYRLLAACFYEPEREMFLDEKLPANLLAALGKLGGSARDACTKMEESLHKNTQEELLVEYSALFLGPFKVLADPHGSIYLEPEERKLMGDTTVRVGDLYKFAGLALQEIEAPDHIALELEFMAFLSLNLGNGVKVIEDNKEEGVPPLDCAAVRSEFLGDLLSPWIPPFCAEIRKNAALDFYPVVADCLETFIETEKATLLPR
ncbi:MAG: molecular chaperone TorD family protein [Desulfurivibrio sp.]|nr:molecular chaperone TorD family protein [Desulfurivibrio sp.]